MSTIGSSHAAVAVPTEDTASLTDPADTTNYDDIDSSDGSLDDETGDRKPFLSENNQADHIESSPVADHRVVDELHLIDSPDSGGSVFNAFLVIS